MKMWQQTQLEEYKILQTKIDKIGEFRIKIREWSITLILAYVLGTKAVQISHYYLLALPVVIFVFYSQERRQLSLQRAFGSRARKLEIAISHGNVLVAEAEVALRAAAAIGTPFPREVLRTATDAASSISPSEESLQLDTELSNEKARAAGAPSSESSTRARTSFVSQDRGLDQLYDYSPRVAECAHRESSSDKRYKKLRGLYRCRDWFCTVPDEYFYTTLTALVLIVFVLVHFLANPTTDDRTENHADDKRAASVNSEAVTPRRFVVEERFAPVDLVGEPIQSLSLPNQSGTAVAKGEKREEKSQSPCLISDIWQQLRRCITQWKEN